MFELVVLSGKGGSGKSSVTAALAHLAREDGVRTVVSDLDVDTPNLHILLDPNTRSREDFISGHLARIDPDRCANCGLCEDLCRFGAIREGTETYEVRPLACEGCRVCVDACPHDAIAFEPRRCGEHCVSDTRFGTLVHAQLFPGQENSGRLVSLLKGRARSLAEAEDADLVLSDGAPGIGCPVIASLSGADLALLVAEPSPSGLHDLERGADLCAHFGVGAAVVVNRADIQPDGGARVRELAAERSLPVLGDIPFDRAVVGAQLRKKAVTEAPRSSASSAIRTIWGELRALIPRLSPPPETSRRTCS